MSDYQQQRLNQKLFGKNQPKKKTKYLRRSYIKKKIADKRVVENEIYQQRRKSYLAKHPLCECGCGRQATQIHHKRGKVGKYKGESLLIVVKFFMAVSDHCHKEIEAKPEWAKKMGYSLKRNIKSEKQPIMKKTTASLLIIFLISLFAVSFSRPASAVSNQIYEDTIKPKKNIDTVYYITNTLPWFQKLFRAVNQPDSVNELERSALSGWLMSIRPLLPLDTPKTKPKKSQ